MCFGELYCNWRRQPWCQMPGPARRRFVSLHRAIQVGPEDVPTVDDKFKTNISVSRTTESAVWKARVVWARGAESTAKQVFVFIRRRRGSWLTDSQSINIMPGDSSQTSGNTEMKLSKLCAIHVRIDYFVRSEFPKTPGYFQSLLRARGHRTVKLGSVARSMLSANNLLRSIKTYTFLR